MPMGRSPHAVLDSVRLHQISARKLPLRNSECAVSGRSNVVNQADIEIFKAHRRPSLAAAGDGHTPSAFRGSSPT